ncbi:MAG: DegV family protein [Anaerolineae bacterium]|jgi:DegV family protein with EDD domain|nr:DegV family protein [Anaerolineae bacterium]
MAVRIVTDSSANVPEEYLSRLKIVEVPAVVNFGQESYLYKKELSLEAFYERLATSERLPTTSQPLPRGFALAYQQAAAEGADEIIAVTVTSKISGTYNSAVIACEDSPVPTRVWDTLHVSMAAGWQTIAAAEMAAGGLSAQQIIEHLERIRSRVRMAFTPVNLKYLIASGRAPRLQGMIGDLLNIKPILVTEDGYLEPVARVRTQRKAQEHMVEMIAEQIGGVPCRVAVGHCNALAEAEAFAERVRAALNVNEFVLFDLGMLAALGGPGLLGLGGSPVEEWQS